MNQEIICRIERICCRRTSRTLHPLHSEALVVLGFLLLLIVLLKFLFIFLSFLHAESSLHNYGTDARNLHLLLHQPFVHLWTFLDFDYD